MTILKKLFGRAGSQQQPLANNGQASDAQVAPEIFADLLPPSALPASKPGNHFTYTRPAVIAAFLARNFFQLGLDDALTYPAAERRESRLRSLVADFRHTLQETLQMLEAQVHELEMRRRLMQGVDSLMEAQLMDRTALLQQKLEQIAHQLELSVDHEGWLAPAVAAYRDGFLAGAHRYQQEQDFLGGLNTLI